MQQTRRARVKKVFVAAMVTSTLVLGGSGAAHAAGAASDPTEYPYDPSHEVEGSNQALVYHVHRQGAAVTISGQLRDVTGQGRELAPESGGTINLEFAALPDGPGEFLKTRIDHNGFYKFPVVRLSIASDLELYSQSDYYPEVLSKSFKFKKLQKAPVRMAAGFGAKSSRTGSTVDIYGSPVYKGAWTNKHAAWASILDHPKFDLQRRIGSHWITLKAIKVGFNDADSSWQSVHYRGTFADPTRFRWVFKGSLKYKKLKSKSFRL